MTTLVVEVVGERGGEGGRGKSVDDNPKSDDMVDGLTINNRTM